MKSYTDIEQSKVLAEILPIESADMYYDRGGLPSLIDKYVTHESIKNDKYQHLIPCWSLTSLLDVLPYPSLHKTFSGWRCDSYDREGTSCKLGEPSGNPVDACVAMIELLYNQKLL